MNNVINLTERRVFKNQQAKLDLTLKLLSKYQDCNLSPNKGKEVARFRLALLDHLEGNQDAYVQQVYDFHLEDLLEFHKLQGGANL
jgi:hypothetical protein